MREIVRIAIVDFETSKNILIPHDLTIELSP